MEGRSRIHRWDDFLIFIFFINAIYAICYLKNHRMYEKRCGVERAAQMDFIPTASHRSTCKCIEYMLPKNGFATMIFDFKLNFINYCLLGLNFARFVVCV